MDTVALVTSDFPVLRREQMWNAMRRLVLNGLSSPHTRRAYSQALGVFVIWFCSEPGRLLTRAVVQEYRVVLERKGLTRSEEHTSELQSLRHLVCRLLLDKSN